MAEMLGAAPARTRETEPPARPASASPAGTPPDGPRGVVGRRGLLDPAILRRAAVDAVRKLDPRVQVRNPVMFVVLIGTVVTAAASISDGSPFAWSVTA
jgi:K+-transporting ATPase ATPase B chain